MNLQLSHAIVGLENAVATQVRLGGDDLAGIADQLLEALRPSLRQTLMEVLEAAATEISSQLPGQRVEIRIREGDPELLVTDVDPSSTDTIETETLEARLTLRLPDSLKSVIEDAAENSGDSINSWIVGALRSKTHTRVGSHVKTTIDL